MSSRSGARDPRARRLCAELNPNQIGEYKLHSSTSLFYSALGENPNRAGNERQHPRDAFYFFLTGSFAGFSPVKIHQASRYFSNLEAFLSCCPSLPGSRRSERSFSKTLAGSTYHADSGTT